MRNIYLSIFLIVFLQTIVLAQTLLDEYGDIRGHEEAARLDAVTIAIQDQAFYRVSFIVYVGDGKERIGSVRPYLKTLKYYLSELRGLDLKKVDFRVAKGRNLFLRQIWALRKNEEIPKSEEFGFAFNNLNKPMLYARTCLNCSGHPAEPKMHLVDWELLTEILKKNKDYVLRIEIEGNEAYGEDGKMVSSKKWVKDLRESFKKKNGILKKRIIFRRIKQKNDQRGTMAFFLHRSKRKVTIKKYDNKN